MYFSHFCCTYPLNYIGLIKQNLSLGLSLSVDLSPDFHVWSETTPCSDQKFSDLKFSKAELIKLCTENK